MSEREALEFFFCLAQEAAMTGGRACLNMHVGGDWFASVDYPRQSFIGWGDSVSGAITALRKRWERDAA